MKIGDNAVAAEDSRRRIAELAVTWAERNGPGVIIGTVHGHGYRPAMSHANQRDLRGLDERRHFGKQQTSRRRPTAAVRRIVRRGF